MENLTEKFGDAYMRITMIDHQMQQLQRQLQSCVTTDVNELQMKDLRSMADRIAHDVQEDQKQLGDLNVKFNLLTQEIQRNDYEDQKRQDQFKLRVMWGIITFIFTLLGTVLAGFITNFIHL